MTQHDATAIHKSIRRHHPFFAAGGMFGFDWRTFHMLYPADCATLRAVVAVERAS